MNIVALKALSKAVIQSNYANKVVKPLETANRLAVRHVNWTVVIQTIVTVEQLPWLVPYWWSYVLFRPFIFVKVNAPSSGPKVVAFAAFLF